MKKWQRYILLLLFLPCSTWGQELTVRDFHIDAEDLSAVKEQVLDHNNKPCALIKVRLSYYQLFFEGDVIYTEYKGDNEYWVYMAPGASWLQIKSPVASPLTYEFNNAVEGLHTYIMYLHLTLSHNYRATPSSTQELKTTTFIEDKNSESDDPQNALIKVRLESFALSFSGDIVEVIPHWNEYWVYMRPGASRLEIMSSIAPPLTYDFNKKLKKGNTYVLQLELKEPVLLPKKKEKQETLNNSKIESEPKELRTDSYINSNSNKKANHYLLSLQYGTAVNVTSHEFGFRYGELFNDNSGWYSEIALVSSTVYYVDFKDTPVSNSENLHLIAGGMLGSFNGPLMGSLGFGCTLGIGSNGCFGLIGECGITTRLYNFVFSIDYEPTVYLGKIGNAATTDTDLGSLVHYLKFGIGYVF